MSELTLEIPRSDLIPVTSERIEQIVGTARPYYMDDGSMLFHGWEHAVAVTNNYMKEWVYCAENGVVTDFEAGVGASAHHDSKYPEKLTTFKTKERRSASVAQKSLRQLGFTDEQLALTKRMILATTVGHECVDDAEKQEVRSDLAAAGFDFKGFLKFFFRFAKEQRNLTGVFKPFEEVRDTQVQVLSTYLNQDLSYSFENSCSLANRGLMNIVLLRKASKAEVEYIAGEEFGEVA